MPGKWQTRILAALARTSPLRLAQLHARGQAQSRSERQAHKRALTQLVALGLVERRARGVYARVEAAAPLEWRYIRLMQQAQRVAQGQPQRTMTRAAVLAVMRRARQAVQAQGDHEEAACPH
jgi:hypothetical protein